jgi:hypothetical protein
MEDPHVAAQRSYPLVRPDQCLALEQNATLTDQQAPIARPKVDLPAFTNDARGMMQGH